MEFAWLDGWSLDLKDAVERSVLKAKPNISADRLARLSKVDDVRSGKCHWEMVAGQLQFAVRLADWTIFGVTGDVIRFRRPFGKIGAWEHGAGKGIRILERLPTPLSASQSF